MAAPKDQPTDPSELARQYAAALQTIKSHDELFREAGPRLQQLAEVLSAKEPGGDPIIASPAVIAGGIGYEFGDEKLVDDVTLDGQSLRDLVAEYQNARQARVELGNALRDTDFSGLVQD